MISLACNGIGCDETILIETFASCTTAELRQGKKAWCVSRYVQLHAVAIA